MEWPWEVHLNVGDVISPVDHSGKVLGIIIITIPPNPPPSRSYLQHLKLKGQASKTREKPCSTSFNKTGIIQYKVGTTAWKDLAKEEF